MRTGTRDAIFSEFIQNHKKKQKAAACKPDDQAVAYNRAYFARWHLEREATPEPSD